MPTDFLQLDRKRILVMGVANRKSVAWHISRVLLDAGAEVVYAVRNEARRAQVQQLYFPSKTRQGLTMEAEAGFLCKDEGIPLGHRR